MIRPCRIADAEPLARLQVAAWWAAYGGYVDHDKIAVVAQRMPATWRERLAAPADVDPGEVWVCEEDGALRGFVSVGAARDRDVRDGDGELRALYVDPERTGAGYGHALLEHAEQRLAALGFGAATLWVFVENGPARAFYERHGWALDDRAGENPWDWGPCLRYRKVLA